MNKFVDECAMMPWKNEKMKKKLKKQREYILQRSVGKALQKELQKALQNNVFFSYEKPLQNIGNVFFSYEKNDRVCDCCGVDEDCGMKRYEHIRIYFKEEKFMECHKLDLIYYLGEILMIHNDQTCYPEIFSFFDGRDVEMRIYTDSNSKEVEECDLRIGEKFFEWKNYMKKYEIFEKLDGIKHNLFECYNRIKSSYEKYPIEYTQRICLLLLMSHRFDKQSAFSYMPLDMVRYISQIIWNSRYENF